MPSEAHLDSVAEQC